MTFCHGRFTQVLRRTPEDAAKVSAEKEDPFWPFLRMLGTVGNFEERGKVGTQADSGSHGLRGTANLVPIPN